MRSDDDRWVRDRLVRAIDAAARELPLRYGDRRALAELATPTRPRMSRRLRVFSLAIVVGALLGTGVAVAAGPGRDRVAEDFTRLHPDKSQVSEAGVEPHVLVGEVAQPDGTRSRLYVTTRTGDRLCWDVVQVGGSGEPLSSVGFCREVPGASLDSVSGVLIGYAPGDGAVSVTVTSGGTSVVADVTRNSFVLPAALAAPGASVVVRVDSPQSPPPVVVVVD